MQFTRFALAAVVASVASAAAAPAALPWANANPHAAAAANAYADAYAEAQAIGHPDPEAYALAASADDCADIACHAACGLLITYGSACTENTENAYAGPYNTTCLCSDGTDFIKQYPACMECGWTLWKYYGGYVSSALAACGTLSTEPTGTSRCSTTLTDSYTIDTSLAACDYTGNCPTTTSTTDSGTTTTDSAPTTTTTDAAPTTTDDAPSTTTDADPTTTDTETDATTETSTDATSDTTEVTTEGTTDGTTEGTTDATTSETTGAPITTTNDQGETITTTPAPAPTGYLNSTSTETDNDQSTTIITITSCSDNACSEVPVTTGVTVITTTEAGVVTEYTTYCPLTSETTEAPVTTTKAPETTTTVAPETTTSETSSQPGVTTFEGKAVVLGSSVLGLALSFLLF